MAELDPCPYCGRDDFGNAGARSQHVRACKVKAEQYNDSQSEEDTVEATPAKADSKPAQSGSQRAAAPDNQNPSGNDSALARAGESMASGLAATLDEDAPVETRKKGVSNLTSLVGGLMGGVMEYRNEKNRREEQNARNVGLEQVEDKPECANCGLTFSQIPENAERVSCPECGAEYRVV